MKSLLRICLFLFLFVATPLFADVNILSPASGKWANKQVLVIDITDGETVFYSYSGSDPSSSGFAYDEPVLIDITGNVELRLSVVDKNNKTSSIVVEYSVEETSPSNPSEEVEAFFNQINTSTIVQVPAGNRFSIPNELQYSLGKNDSTYENGTELYCSKDSLFERYVPCTVKIDDSKWRFIIHSTASSSGELAEKTVPYKIVDWNKIILTDKKLIYSLDGGNWVGSSKPLTVERNTNHVLQWQSVDYNASNPIQFAIIPSKPNLITKALDDKSIQINIDGEKSYRMACSNKTPLLASGLYSNILLDIYSGDKVEGSLTLDLFSDNVYQGSIAVPYKINRKRPAAPIIITSSDDSYLRKPVTLSFSADKDSSIFYSVLTVDNIKPSFDSQEIKFNESNQYSKYTVGDKVLLPSNSEKIIAYKVIAYSYDDSDFKSELSSKTFIIDSANYYVDPSSTNEKQDGTPYAPFTNLDKVYDLVNTNTFIRFLIKGSVSLPKGQIDLFSNCEFVGIDDSSRIIASNNTTITVRNSSFAASNIVFEKENSSNSMDNNLSKANSKLFTIEQGTANFKNCEISTIFDYTGTTFSLSKAILTLDCTGITSCASSYVSCIDALDSRIYIFNSRISSAAPTTVNLSLKKSSLQLENSSCKVTGKIGRIAELLETNYTLKNNNYKASLENKVVNNKAIWIDDKSNAIEDIENVSSGF